MTEAEKHKQWQRDYMERLKADPAKLAAHYEKRRADDKRRRELVKADPAKLQHRRERYKRWCADPVNQKRLKASKRAYMERKRADPEFREHMKTLYRKSWRKRFPPKDKVEKVPTLKVERKPLPVKPINVREYSKQIARQRGRPSKKVKVSKAREKMQTCSHQEGFTFHPIEGGMRRTCKACGRTFTELSKPQFA